MLSLYHRTPITLLESWLRIDAAESEISFCVFIPHIHLPCQAPTLPAMQHDCKQLNWKFGCFMTKILLCGSHSITEMQCSALKSIFVQLVRFLSNFMCYKDMISLPVSQTSTQSFVFVGMRDQFEGLNPRLCGDEWMLCFCTICVSKQWANEIWLQMVIKLSLSSYLVG